MVKCYVNEVTNKKIVGKFFKRDYFERIELSTDIATKCSGKSIFSAKPRKIYGN